MRLAKPATDTAFNRVWDLLQQCQSPVFHAIGNHDLYNFKPSEIRSLFNEEGGSQVGKYEHDTILSILNIILYIIYTNTI